MRNKKTMGPTTDTECRRNSLAEPRRDWNSRWGFGIRMMRRKPGALMISAGWTGRSALEVQRLARRSRCGDQIFLDRQSEYISTICNRLPRRRCQCTVLEFLELRRGREQSLASKCACKSNETDSQRIMKIGIMFPQTDIRADSGEIKEFVQAIERMGFNHVLAIEHVMGVNRASRPEWSAPYDSNSNFNEPFVFLSYVAGIAPALELATGILILPQRQTVLVAKQSACLDVMCNGRLRLGVGTGWNTVEYEALGMDFAKRASRFEEQIDLLRALWTKPTLSWNRPHHTITDAGISPLPLQRPIPLWLGGGGLPAGSPLWYSPANDKVIRRIARVADGWIPNWNPDEHGHAMMEKFREYCREFGRDPRDIGLEGRITLNQGGERQWMESLEAWRNIGATHVTLNTMLLNLHGAEQHLRRIEEFRRALPADALPNRGG